MYGRSVVGLWPLVRSCAHSLTMFTPSQVSEMLDIPGSSLRRLASQFSDRLSESANKRRRTYTDEDIKVLKRVRELTGQGMSIEEIKNVIDVAPSDSALAKVPESSLALLPEVLQEFESLRSEISDLRSEVNELKEWKSERDAKTAEYKKIPRWRRVFTDPPD